MYIFVGPSMIFVIYKEKYSPILFIMPSLYFRGKRDKEKKDINIVEHYVKIGGYFLIHKRTLPYFEIDTIYY